MLKALLKKQIMETNTWLLQDKKRGKARSMGSRVGMLVLYLFLFVFLGVVFFVVGTSLCEALVSLELGWLYFSLMALLSVFLGVFGSVFNTYATLYVAKDNEFLLSLPVTPSVILAARLFAVWMWSLLYEAIVFVPALIAYWLVLGTSLTPGAVLFGLLVLMLLSVFVLTLSCVLGWVVAKIAIRLKRKSFVAVIASVIFLGAYYYVYFQASQLLQAILQHADAIGNMVRGWAVPLYWLGRAGEGDPLSALFTLLIIAALFALTYWVMARSFLNMATTNRGTVKRGYKEKPVRQKRPGIAVLHKEILRFFSSATYMLNCGLGILILPIMGVAALIFGSTLREIAGEYLSAPGLVALLASAAICGVSSMNDISAPSVSLEGETIWLVQSLPVTSWTVLKAKLGVHLLFTEIPAFFAAVCLAIALRVSLVDGCLIMLVPLAYVLFSAAFGLFLNLKSPNLHWSSETVPVKQSMGVMICLFGGWGLIVLFGLLYFLLHQVIAPQLFLLLCGVAFLALFLALSRWLKIRGAEIFTNLG